MIPLDAPLHSAVMVQELATGAVFMACNCPNTLPQRTLRYVANNRDKFKLWVRPKLATATAFDRKPAIPLPEPEPNRKESV